MTTPKTQAALDALTNFTNWQDGQEPLSLVTELFIEKMLKEKPAIDLAELPGWLKTIVDLPNTMNFCGNFSEEYKAGSRDGMRASGVAAEQCLKLLEAYAAQFSNKGETK